MRTTGPLLKVLRVLGDGEAYGYDIIRATGLKSGTLYPLLHRIENDGWVRSRWEQTNRNGPRRRSYHLTASGQRAAADIFTAHGIN